MPAVQRRPMRARRANPYMIPVLLVAAGVLIAQMFWLKKNDFLFRPFQLERITCDNCGGTGVVRDGRDDEILRLCPTCFGVGSHNIRRIDAEDRLCPACVGMGRVKDEGAEEWRTCRRCDGRGLTRIAPWATTKSSFVDTSEKEP